LETALRAAAAGLTCHEPGRFVPEKPERRYLAMTYQELRLAREVFGIGEHVTMREIKSRHRELVKLHHPDAGNAEHPELIRKVNAAYQVLLEYVNQYSFCLAEDEFYQQNPEERIRRQFMDDQLWGNG
jgi:hypothetical protein